MKRTVRRTALALLAGIGLVAAPAVAEDHELERAFEQEEVPREMEGEEEDWEEEAWEEWQEQGQQAEESDYPRRPRDDRERDRDRDRDDRPDLLRAPGPSAEERARDGLETNERRPVPWVDVGPETDVDSQLEAVDQLMGADTGVVARELDGHDYCGLGCGGSVRTYRRGQNPQLYYVTCFRNRTRCTNNCGECGCAVYNSPKGGTERSHYREGAENGKIQLEDAAEANGHDWYCYCVED